MPEIGNGEMAGGWGGVGVEDLPGGSFLSISFLSISILSYYCFYYYYCTNERLLDQEAQQVPSFLICRASGLHVSFHVHFISRPRERRPSDGPNAFNVSQKSQP